jgi:uncharacterized membrane protein
LLCPAAASIIFLGIDGIGQLKNKWLSTNPRRLLTGLLCGYFVTIFNVKLIFVLIDFVR